MTEILITAFYIVVCVLLFALAILIHEFGHFIVALKLGLRVDAFSIGFGPAIWKKKYKGVEYRISCIPLGGYVSIPDVDPEGTKALEGARDSEQRTVNSEQRTVNGEQRTVNSEQRTVNGEQIGGESGVRKRIAPWKEIAVAVAGPAMNVVLAVVLAVALSLVPTARFGTLSSRIGCVPKDGPAAAAGLKAGDLVTAVGGRPVETWTEMQTEVQIAGGKSVEFVVERGGADGAKAQEVRLQVTPRRDDVSGAWYILALSETNTTGAVAWMPARNPWQQLAWDAGSIFRVLKGLVTPKEAKATAGALGGPVMIAEGLYRQVRRDKWDGIGFLRFLNVNLAVLNLLPIPVLDGGLILFAFIALVCRRRLPDWFIAKVSMAFMVLLMGLMGVLVLKDTWRSYKIHTYKPENAAATADTPNAQTNDVHAKPDAQP